MESMDDGAAAEDRESMQISVAARTKGSRSIISQ